MELDETLATLRLLVSGSVSNARLGRLLVSRNLRALDLPAQNLDNSKDLGLPMPDLEGIQQIAAGSCSLVHNASRVSMKRSHKGTTRLGFFRYGLVVVAAMDLVTKATSWLLTPSSSCHYLPCAAAVLLSLKSMVPRKDGVDVDALNLS